MDGAGHPVRIFTAERIIALDGTEPEAFAVRDGWIAATGTLALLEEQYPDAEQIRLHGALVVPGFNDAHCHVSQAALARARLDLTEVDHPDDLRRTVTARAATVPDGAWVIGHALDDRRLTADVVNRAFLDSISGDRPILLIQYSFHRAVANSAALDLMGYRTAADAPAGGQLLTDEDGSLNGWMFERAWLDQWLPGTGRGKIVDATELSARTAALAEVNAELHAVGITSYCDAIVTPVEEQLYRAALDAGTLTPRVNMLLWHSYFDPASPPVSPADTRLRFAGVKMMLDGALGGGTCLCSRPYPGESDSGNGLQVLDDEQFTQQLRQVHDAGLRAAVHANGDLAISKVLDATEALPPEPAEARMNHRIEHCSIVDAGIIDRIKRAGVTPVPFGAFVHFYGRQITTYYGEDRAQFTCAHRSMLDAGIAVAGSSDYPIVPIDPLVALQSMVTRESADGLVVGPQQRLDVLDALGVYTHGSAAATGEAHVKGRLTPGQLADFVVLDQDITTVESSEIHRTTVRSTWVGGECVWSAP
ncbi:amidohydrolase [uncultured Arthrobacter sp.]|uniref:amidohydrolase n=1 Tax=uncultured Arthrobacter sp. TaxID=114050 RepID=UPI002615E9E6|nr:amidohydrolase [uncultured Arthrobacter sp.]